MSLDESAMRGTVPGDLPITEEFVRGIGGVQTRGDHWVFHGEFNVVNWYKTHGVWIGSREIPAVNTRQRLVYLLKALGI